jgi:hypothetical protein
MDQDQHKQAHDTKLLLLLLIFVFVTMVLLTLTLVRMGSLDRKVGMMLAAPRMRGGWRRPEVEFFYVK